MVSSPPTCPPIPTVLNIGQFLDEDTTGHGWGVQQWLEAYTHVLQHIREAAEGRCCRPDGKGFAPKVSLLAEAFIGMMGAQFVEACGVSCWNNPLEDIPCQRDEGALAM